MRHNVKVIVSFPFDGRFVPPEWAVSISCLRYPPGINSAYVFTKGMKRDEARTFLCEKAIEAGAEYLFFIDDDTAPPPDAPIKLITALDQADDDVIACGGIYTTKADPPMPLVYKTEMSGPYWKWKFGEIFECEVVATGCMLVRLDGLKDIPKPWFRDILTVEEAIGDPIAIAEGDLVPDQFNMTDDVYFCRKAAAFGKKVLAHGGVLPIHINQQGRAFTLPNDVGPLKGLPPEALWYNRFIEALTAEEAHAKAIA